ncbi:Thioredoxin-like [Callorhinchus milii]|uniref:Thioredoxin n=1 Tax=Callorhinchus milii TaxID=7868 RepID=K4G0D4_CALMI|nr:thioredoxin-like [Callorhinchus milii]AFK11071.1 thioredoxin [Callorhinchus milii]
MPCKHLETLNEFNCALKEAGDKLVVIDFHASWCGPCKAIAPFYQELSEQYTNVIFCKVDVDDAEEITETCVITSMPTFLFFKNEVKVSQLTGANNEKLKALTEQHQ